MKFKKYNSRLLLALSLTVITHNTHAMESTPPSGMAGWISEHPWHTSLTLIGGILLGTVALKTLFQQPESFPFAGLPPEMQNYIITLITIGATSETLEEATSAIRALSLVNKEFNQFFNDPQFFKKLINNLAKRFNTNNITVCKTLQTQAAKLYLQAQDLVNFNDMINAYSPQFINRISMALNNQYFDVNEKKFSNGRTLLMFMLSDLKHRIQTGQPNGLYANNLRHSIKLAESGNRKRIQNIEIN